jgi:hypothetical protein
MISIREIKSIDLSSYTIILTGISVLFAVIFALIVTIAMGIAAPDGIIVSIYLIPTIIVGTLMYSIYRNFLEGYLYNTLSKRLKTIKFTLNDEKEIVNVTTTETAIIISVILTIEVVLIYLVSVFLLPLIISSIVETLMYSGQQMLAYSLYQFLLVLSQPITIIMIIVGTFLLTFVFILIGCYIYNAIAKKGMGINVDLSEKDNITVLNSIDPLKLGITLGIIGGIFNLIFAIISIIIGGDITSAIGNVIGEAIGSFVSGTLFAVFYNFLAPKLGKLKIKLIGI